MQYAVYAIIFVPVKMFRLWRQDVIDCCPHIDTLNRLQVKHRDSVD